MTALVRPLFLAIFLLTTILGITQTPSDSLQLFGCHYLKSKIPLTPLTEQEKMLACGSNERSDSIDILNYNVTLNLTEFTTQMLSANCEITFTPKINGLEALPLDLLDLTVDAVTLQGNPVAFEHDGLLLNILLPSPLDIGETASVTVTYHGHPTADPSGFGGFVFENGYAYNLGIGLSSNPYNFGRSWHPCFDNFVERATYDFSIISNGNRRGYAIGEFLDETDLGNSSFLRRYRMSLPLPTYLVGTATSTYGQVHQTHSGAYGDHPVLLLGKPSDTTQMKTAFAYLGDAVDAFESWFGPYIWGQVGYVLTTAGAMEHASLIAFPEFIIDNGPNEDMNRLMAHELGHHWWGNITTLSCPSDMWIKEGNAEYSAHLFTEYAFGKEAFLNQVKGNHYSTVLKKAHTDDGGIYHPLSGIPYEFTYGTHTYNKGASMMHNLRGYLGDTLFSQGMRGILEDFAFQSVDAELFRDKLTEGTGIDMTSFFNDWIFSPGYSVFELDSVHYDVAGSGYDATVFVQQKRWKAPNFHTNVPLSITFYDENWQTHTATVMASGEFSTATVDVPFLPVWQILNDDGRLNCARLQDRKVVKEADDFQLRYVEVSSLEATAVPDSALVSMVHYWGAPDPPVPNPPNFRMSGTHYWRYGGIIPFGFKAKCIIQYLGANENNFDYDLTGSTEDSIILVWRPDTKTPWAKYPYYKKLAVGNTTDGNGFIRIDTMLPGDFAFANGDLPLATAAFEGENQPLGMTIFPNPAGEALTVSAILPRATELSLELLNATGQPVRQEDFFAAGGSWSERMELTGLPPGFYCLKMSDREGRFSVVRKIIVAPQN